MLDGTRSETRLAALERFEFTRHPDGPTKRTEERVIACFKARAAAAAASP